MRRKRDSKRRWIARFYCGKPVPLKEMVEHGLIQRFERSGIESIYDMRSEMVRKVMPQRGG